VKKKDLLIVQIVDTIVITVVILKMLLFIVVIQNQNQNIMLVNLTSTGILLNGTMIVLSLLLLLFGLENNGEPFVMTMLINMEKHLLMLL
jgi:hypothetical protein